MFEDKIVLITGAYGAVGEACAHAFGRSGAHLVLLGRRRKKLEDLEDRLRAEGLRKVTLILMDTTDFDAYKAVGENLLARFGRLDIFIDAAAILGTLGPLSQMTPALFHEVMAANLHAPWHWIRHLEPLLERAAAARVLFFTDAAALQAYWGSYALSKAALGGLVKIWGEEKQKTALRVNLLSLPPLRNGLRRKAFPGENPLRQRAPREIEAAILTLCHPSYDQTGQTIAWGDMSSLSQKGFIGG